MPETQSYQTHRRWHAPFHFVAFPLAALNLIWWIWSLVKAPGAPAVMGLMSAVALLLGVFLARSYSLRVQDRLIRLEETLRMQALLPAALQSRLHELRPSQFVGLRFASDAELLPLVERVLMQKESLDGEAIKKSIKTWRPDTLRV